MIINIIISIIFSLIFIILYKIFETMKESITSKNEYINELKSKNETLLVEIDILKEKFNDDIKTKKIKIGTNKKINKKNITKYSNINVLIVDYMVESSNNTKAVLEDFGINVDVVRNKQDTETVLKSKKDYYSIIFTNNVLKSSSGHEIFDLTKDINPDIKVVLTTISHISELSGVLDFDGYLQKCVTHEAVEKVLKSIFINT